VPSANSVFIVDGQRVVTQVALAGTPTRMAVDDSAGRLYVADFLSGEVTVVDAAAGAVVERRTLDNPTRQDAIEVDRAHNRLLLSNRSFSLDRLEPTGHYSITGFTIPYGEGILPDTLLVNPRAPRFYATASNGIPGSNGGTIVYAIDGDALKQIALNGDRNVTSLALDAGAQRLYVSASHPLALTNRLNVLDARSLDLTASLGLPARASAMAVNPATHHLFLTYSASYRPAPADNTLQVLDTRTLGMVVSLRVDAEPAAIGLQGDLVYVASKTQNPLTVVRDCPGEPPPAPTSTPTPTAYPTLPPEATSTAKPATTARPPAPCAMATASWLKAVLDQHDELRVALDCPSELPRATQMAEQSFQNGLMVWLEDTRTIYVLRNDGTWAVYDDTWDETQPEGGFYTPPPGLREPVRGFGKVWREQLGAPNAAIGWATAREVGLNGQMQGFAGGLALGNDRGTRVLLANGTWRQ
jgi:DNA-binding beta-propeller fold protein YncE